jgi:hypothetical protein
VARGTDEVRVGLCLTCRHARVVESGRGSIFYLCRRSETDSRFVKYPPLPVRTCVGYEPKLETSPSDST